MSEQTTAPAGNASSGRASSTPLVKPDDLRDWFLALAESSGHLAGLPDTEQRDTLKPRAQRFEALRMAALDGLAKVSFPGRKTESWRYTSIQPLVAAVNDSMSADLANAGRAVDNKGPADNAEYGSTPAENTERAPAGAHDDDAHDDNDSDAYSAELTAVIDNADLIVRLESGGLSSLQCGNERASALFNAALEQQSPGILAGVSSPIAAGSDRAFCGSSNHSDEPDLLSQFDSLVPVGYFPFVDLNTAFLGNCVEIDCLAADDSASGDAKTDQHDGVLKILILSDDSGAADAHGFRQLHSRVLLRLGKLARVELTEVQLCSDPETGSADHGGRFESLVLEADLSEGSSLEHYRFSMGSEAASVYSGAFVKLGGHARYLFNGQNTGSAINRTDLTVNLAAGGAYAAINANMLLKDKRRCDYHTCLEHSAAHAESDEQVRTLVDDKARAVFNGRIHIHPHAQKTRAEMNNRNLLMSSTAEVDTKPELEIYADDVMCAHGATIGQLDANAVFYCKSRGIDEQTSRALLSEAFMVETINLMPGKIQQALALSILKDYQEQR